MKAHTVSKRYQDGKRRNWDLAMADHDGVHESLGLEPPPPREGVPSFEGPSAS